MKNQLQWIISVILCIVGVLFIMMSFMFANFDVNKYVTRGKFMEKKKEIEMTDIRNIDIRSVEANILVKESVDDKIHITYHENDTLKQKYKIYIDGNTLYMKRKAAIHLFQLNPFNYIGVGNENITVEIPKGKIEELRVHSVSGKIKVNPGNYHKVFIENTAGSASVRMISAEQITMETVSGHIDVNAFMGSVLVAKTVSSSIEVEKVDAKDISMKTVSGRIEGSLYGKEDDFTTTIKTVSGAHNIINRKGTTNKKIKAETVSGNIQMNFIEK